MGYYFLDTQYNYVDDVGGPVQDRLPETAAQPQEEDSRH